MRDEHRKQREDAAIRLSIPPRLIVVPATAFMVGCAIGMVRGGRNASLRFLAENAHRPPTTVQGWYFYKKTKNYKVMWGALKGAGREAVKVTALAGSYVGVEEGLERAGWGTGKHVGAAVGTAVIFSIVCEWNGWVLLRDTEGKRIDRLPMNVSRRAIVLGAMVGLGMSGLEWGRSRPVDRIL